MLNLNTPVKNLIGVGPKMAKRLEKLGVENVQDLLFHFPFRYDDFSKVTPIAKIKPGTFCVKGKILEIKNQRTSRRRMFLTHAIIQDDSGSLKAIWFNQPYLARMLKKGSGVVLAGKVEYSKSGLAMQSPTYEEVKGEQAHVGRIVPVYPETEGLNSKWLRRQILPLLKLADGLKDYLPAEILKRNSLMSLPEALRQIHFPDSMAKAQEAKKRLAFDELFLLQLKMLEARQKWQTFKAPKINLDIDLVKKLVSQLPFKLTNAQRRAAWEILQDLSGQHMAHGTSQMEKNNKQYAISDKQCAIGDKPQTVSPMNRLLEGDVGSGKTIVAAIAMLVCAKSGFQSILMAPTEVLAQQHFVSISDLLAAFGVRTGLLISAKAATFPDKKNQKRPGIISDIKAGKIDLVIGTQALIAEKMNFKKVGLAVIDEQHRFGVKQRALLRKKAQTTPHLLSMTATPIPRTLTLALYGDLDLSVIDEMPPGRQKISTHLVKPEKRTAAYKFISDQISQGRQIFVICPLIEESRLRQGYGGQADKLEVKAAETEYKKLHKEIFPQFKIGLLHGKMKSKEKEKIMLNFKAGKLDILVSTAVVEVGVDVPNATVMMIEGAERFGLAQLHQFRGRVGRAEFKSYCFLFCENPSAKTFERLSALVHLYDGFKLAEKDLQIRGPGEVYGVRQHGLADLKMASLMDVKMIKLAREEAGIVVGQGLEKFPRLEVQLREYKNRLIGYSV